MAVAGLLLTGSPEAVTTTVNVNTTDDVTGQVGVCSLRDAVNAANTNMNAGGCPAGQASPAVDVIRLPAGLFGLEGTIGEDGNVGGDLDITESVVLEGTGWFDALGFDVLGLAIEGKHTGVPLEDIDHWIDGLPNADVGVVANAIGDPDIPGDGGRVIHVDPTGGGSVDLTLRRLVIAHGDVSCTGAACEPGAGGIENSSDLSLIDVLIWGNSTAMSGGGIVNGSGDTLSLTRAWVVRNSAEAGVGGILNEGTTGAIILSVLADNDPFGTDCVNSGAGTGCP